MSAAPAFQFYPSDFLVGTADMGADEVGAYIRLLCYQWDKGALPSDTKKLAALAGCRRGVIDAILHKFSAGTDGMLRNQRMEAVRTEQNEFRARQAGIAKKGWERRKQTDARPVPGHPSGTPAAGAKTVPESCSPPSPPPPIIDPPSGASAREMPKYPCPTLPQAIAFGQNAGHPDDCVTAWWSDCESRPRHPNGAYTDRDGNMIFDWQAHLVGFGTRWRSNEFKRRAGGVVRAPLPTPTVDFSNGF